MIRPALILQFDEPGLTPAEMLKAGADAAKAQREAASAMLAALKEAKEQLKPIMTKDDRDVFQRVSAAIAQAEAAGIKAAS